MTEKVDSNIHSLEEEKKKQEMNQDWQKNMQKVYQNNNQWAVDKEIQTVCASCKHLIDASEEYGATAFEKTILQYSFCAKAVIQHSENAITNIDPISGKRQIYISFVDKE